MGVTEARRLAVGICVGGALVVLPLSRGTLAADGDPVLLVSHLHVEAAGSRSATVRLDRPLVIPSTGFKRSTRIQGGGRFVGFILDGPAGQVVTWLSTFCGIPACTPDSTPSDIQSVVVRNPGSGTALPPGLYRLTVIADGTPVSIDVDLLGQPLGTLNLVPTGPADVEVRSVVPTAEIVPGAVFAYSAGAVSTPSTKRALIMDQMSVAGQNLQVGQFGGCFYQGGAPPGDVYIQGCPGGGTPTLQYMATSPGGGRVTLAGVLPLGPPHPLPIGTYALGDFFEAAQAPTTVAHVAVVANLPGLPVQLVKPAGAPPQPVALPNTGTTDGLDRLERLLAAAAMALTSAYLVMRGRAEPDLVNLAQPI